MSQSSAKTCPHCESENVCKRGAFHRPSDGHRIRRFSCRGCGRSFSEQTLRFDYRLRKRRINHACFMALCSGVSQRRAAQMLHVRRKAIALRIERFGVFSKEKLEEYRKTRAVCHDVCFDEMESFEHTKCKPLTIPLAVENKTRFILSLEVGQIAAKGPLAQLSRKKYGPRRCERRKVLKKLFTTLSECCSESVTFRSDKSRHYPKPLAQHFPRATHIPTKGDRGCVVGQGELKARAFDPLFSLNHTCAMIRDNLKRMSRRTWCTTKKTVNLKHLLHMYAWFHNSRLLKKRALLAG